MKSSSLPVLLAFMSACFGPAMAPADDDCRVYIGTFTRGGDSVGIYQFRLDLETGRLTAVNQPVASNSPAFLAFTPDGSHLYAVNEVSDFAGKKSGAVAAYRIDSRTGDLSFINHSGTVGPGPCHVTVDKTGRNVLVANYGGGSAAVLPIRQDGGVGEASSFVQHVGSSINPQRQTAPHAHSINLSPDNKFAFVADLGLDQVLVYRFDADAGTLTPNDPPFASTARGAGPRHFAFQPDGHFAYVINELGNTVLPFGYDAERGMLSPLTAVSTLPADFTGKSFTAEVQVHPSGRFVYGSNRGHDSITLFQVRNDGTLERVENTATQGKTPRNFGIDPTGNFLIAANQATNDLVVFRIDQKSGRLTATGESADVPTPVCVKFLMLGE